MLFPATNGLHYDFNNYCLGMGYVCIIAHMYHFQHNNVRNKLMVYFINTWYGKITNSKKIKKFMIW